MQMEIHDTFEGRVRQQPNGTYSLSNLTMFDLQRIKSALAMDLTNSNVAAHQPQPHWWNEAGEPDNDHRVWFESWVRYYRSAVQRLEAAGIR